MKRFLCAVLAAVMLFCCLPTALAADGSGTMKDAGLSYTESTDRLPNPHMNYPSHASITLTRTGNQPRNDKGFTWYYININPFSAGNARLTDNVAQRYGFTPLEQDEPISQNALDALDGTLTNLRLNGGSCLIRFVYDWNGVPGCEPSSFDMILTHIRQLCAVVAKYDDICLGFECGIIGVFGEMHSSDYCGAEYANPIIDTYLENTPDSMILMVRSPSYIMNYLGLTRGQLSELVTEKGSPEYRLSYFNDGYMNTDNDTGTWGDRKLDLKFLASQSEHATYGGEYGSAYWLLPSNVCLPENAIPEMYQTHVNFIRGNVYKLQEPGEGNRNTYFGYDQYTYSKKYEKEWFPDNSAFYGVDCHTFIVAHIGYRLVLRGSKLTARPKAGGTLRLTGSIENTGFANILHNPKTQIVLQGVGYSYTCEVSLDAAQLKSCTTTDYDLTLQLPASMPAGEYSVYMRMAASTDTFYTTVMSGIRFANDFDIFNSNIGANLIGTVSVAAADTVTSAASDVFCEVGKTCRAGALSAQGAPALAGHGLPTTGKLALSYAQGDEICLSAQHMLAANQAVSYVWQKDGTTVSTEAQLVIASATKADAGEYRLTVTANRQTVHTATVTVTVNDHKFAAEKTLTAPTCHSSGISERTCTHCSLTERRVIPALSHTAGQEQITEPTCYLRGSRTVRCTACGDVLSYRTIEKIEHSWHEKDTPATCTANGSHRTVCSICGLASTETISALGHDYVYTVSETAVSGLCSRCFETAPAFENGKVNPGVSADRFDGKQSGAVTIGSDPIVLVGKDGYLSEYTTAASTDAITFLFRVEGAEQPISLGKFRTITYAYDDRQIPADSNDNANYYGDCLYQVSGDGLWALTISKLVMCARGNQGFGKVVSAMFNDPDAKETMKDTDNPNENATMELVGIYDGTLPYSVIYIDENGRSLCVASGDHVGEVRWANKINRIKTAGEMYNGPVPTKKADSDWIYTFDGWEDLSGNLVNEVIANVIVRPHFAKTANTCTHPSVHSGTIKQPTCTEEGLSGNICDLCGAAIGATTALPKSTHKNTAVADHLTSNFFREGQREVRCADCLVFLRTEKVPAVANPFTDVKQADWYADTVCYAYINQYFGGTSATTFSPNMTMTRGMFVTVLGRIADAPAVSVYSSHFSDVPRGEYYAPYVDWAYANGIVNGRTENTFEPNGNITREEMCVMIERFCKAQTITLLGSPNATRSFADATRISGWASNAVDNCRRAALVTGKSTDQWGQPLFEPKGNATRAEVATILQRLVCTYIGG